MRILAKWDKVCRKLPKRVIHYDAKINNFLFKKNTNKVIALIDLDTLMPGCFLSDIGDMIRTYSNTLGEESKDISKVTCNKNISKLLKIAKSHNVKKIGFNEKSTYMSNKFNLKFLLCRLLMSLRIFFPYHHPNIIPTK